MPVLLEAISPHDNLQAIVEEDAGAIYFYLWGGENSPFGMKSCWVRNLKAAPKQLSELHDRPPLLPQPYCKHPKGAPKLKEDQLNVVWLEEGDGAALLEGDKILAIIPSWSGESDFHGYARDCAGESPVAWELGPDNALVPRVESAVRFWNSWNEADQPWRHIQETLLDAIEARLGPYQKYFAIDGGTWPPKAIVQMDVPDGTALVTLGVSIRPQPRVEMFFEDPSPLRRFELAVGMSKEFGDDVIGKIGGYISGQSRFPWDRFTWLGPGHTIGCDVFPGFTAVMLCGGPVGVPQIELPPQAGDPVSILWLVPITQPELELTMEQGSEALLEKLAANGNFWVHRNRASVV